MLGVGPHLQAIGELVAQSKVSACAPCITSNSISNRILGSDRISVIHCWPFSYAQVAFIVVVFGGQLQELLVELRCAARRCDGPCLEDEFRHRGMPVSFLQVQIESPTFPVLSFEKGQAFSLVPFDDVLFCFCSLILSPHVGQHVLDLSAVKYDIVGLSSPDGLQILVASPKEIDDELLDLGNGMDDVVGAIAGFMRLAEELLKDMHSRVDLDLGELLFDGLRSSIVFGFV